MLVALGAGLLYATNSWFVEPSEDPIGDPQAIVLIQGGRGERFDRASELLAEMPDAPLVMVTPAPISHPTAVELQEVCATEQTFEVICIDGDPADTIEEVELLSDYLEQREWDEVVVVTSKYHVYRVGLLFRRCYDGEAAMAYGNLTLWPTLILHEWGGLLKAGFIDPAC